ncbi:MAG: hypothetical protein QXF26_06245 [Candidatus Bathyarchaeia archaeon]
MSEIVTLTVVIGAVAIVIVAAIALRRPRLGEVSSPQKESKTSIGKIETMKSVVDIPKTFLTSVSEEDVKKAEEDLRILSVEKEIVSYALTRLYEAQAEGKITENEKTRLLSKYKEEMDNLEKSISNKQMIVRLHELEVTQADLVKLFQEKFAEITRNIDRIRTELGILPKPVPQVQEKAEAEPTEKKTEERAPPRPRAPPRSKVDEKVASIQQEVLKILERLEKQESEA